MNTVTIAGHLGSDPEVRFTSSGQKVTTLRVAARARRGKNDDTIWWRVTLWGDQFDKLVSYLKKGSAVMVIGDLTKPEIFTDREGKPQISMSMTAFNVQFSPFGKPQQSDHGHTPMQQNREASHQAGGSSSFAEDAFDAANSVKPAQNSQGAGAAATAQDFDDEVPF